MLCDRAEPSAAVLVFITGKWTRMNSAQRTEIGPTTEKSCCKARHMIIHIPAFTDSKFRRTM